MHRVFNKRNYIFLGAFVAFGIALSIPWIMQKEEPLDDTFRAVGGQVHKRHGVTHYELIGPKSQPVVVLVHGVSGPMKVWDKMVAFLGSAGFRVLRYDLFGRGLSDRVKATYNLDLYDEQLTDLLDGLEIREPVSLVGSSMGAIVSTEFALRHPERVSSVTLIGPAGFPIQASVLSGLLYVPYLGEYVMRVAGNRFLMAHHRKYFVNPHVFPEMEEAFASQLKVAGTKGAILSTMRHMPVQDFSKGYEKLGHSSEPVLLVWGTEDKTFPFSNHTAAQKLLPKATFHPIQGAAHLPQYEMAHETGRRIVQFLRLRMR